MKPLLRLLLPLLLVATLAGPLSWVGDDAPAAPCGPGVTAEACAVAQALVPQAPRCGGAFDSQPQKWAVLQGVAERRACALGLRYAGSETRPSPAPRDRIERPPRALPG